MGMAREVQSDISLEYRYYDLAEDFPVLALLENNFVFKADTTKNITRMHFHNCIEISYCYCGSKNVFVEGKTLEFAKGDICVLLPYAMHITKDRRLHENEKGCRCEYLYFDPEGMLKEYYPNGLPGEMLWYKFSNFNAIISGIQNPQIEQSILYILNELRYRRSGYRIAVRAMLLSLMTELSRILPKPGEPEMSYYGKSPGITPALQYIHTHYNKSIQTKELAELCHMSLPHFRRCFKQLANGSPTKYINSVRLRRACELLESTENTILDIALSVGFESVSSFNRLFTEVMKETPSQWRSRKCVVKKKKLKHSTFNFEH